MTPQECDSLIDQFKTQHADAIVAYGIHGLYVTWDEGNFTLDLFVSRHLEDQTRSEMVIRDEFKYEFNGEFKLIKARIVQKTIATPSVRHGDSAKGKNSGGKGTAGWNVYLLRQQIAVCVSCAHVICERFDDLSHALENLSILVFSTQRPTPKCMQELLMSTTTLLSPSTMIQRTRKTHLCPVEMALLILLPEQLQKS